MTSSTKKSPYLEMSEALAAHGYAAESVRVKALQSYRPLPGDIPPLARALLPDATAEEAVAIDLATQLAAMVEGLTKDPQTGVLPIATIVFALSMLLRRYSKLAAAATIDDGRVMGDAFAAGVVEQANAYQDRLQTLTEIMLGKADNTVHLVDEKGRPL